MSFFTLSPICVHWLNFYSSSGDQFTYYLSASFPQSPLTKGKATSPSLAAVPPQDLVCMTTLVLIILNLCSFFCAQKRLWHHWEQASCAFYHCIIIISVTAPSIYSGSLWDKPCVNHVFLMLSHLGLCWLWRDCSSQGESVPIDSKWITGERVLHKQTNQSRAQTPNFIKLLLYSRPLFPCPNHPRARYQTPRDNPCAPESAEIIQTGQSQNCLPCLVDSFPGKPQ